MHQGSNAVATDEGGLRRDRDSTVRRLCLRSRDAAPLQRLGPAGRLAQDYLNPLVARRSVCVDSAGVTRISIECLPSDLEVLGVYYKGDMLYDS